MLGMHQGQKANCLCLASPNLCFQRSLYSLLISRSVSRFLIVSLLSNFFLPFTKAISNLIFLFLLYTEIGTIVKLLFFSLSANSFISFFVSKSFLLRSGS